MKVARSPTPDELARACADAMWKDDNASGGLGMEILDIGAGRATLTMIVKPNMVNGHDSTFAFACNSYNERAVAAHCNISFIRPGKRGDRLVATGREISRSGRSGIYDIRVTVDDVVVAELRGHSRTIGGALVPLTPSQPE